MDFYRKKQKASQDGSKTRELVRLQARMEDDDLVSGVADVKVICQGEDGMSGRAS